MAFGCARVVFNDALAARQAGFKAGEPYLTDAAMSARLTESKTVPERAWLHKVSAAVLQQALADLNRAYRNFFDSSAGKRKGPRLGPPRFRSRKEFRITKPTSKLDSLRVLDEAGVAPASYRTLKRRLPAYAEEGWRQQLSEAAVGTSSPVGMFMTVTAGPVPDGWLPG
jgi:transposase